MGPGITHVTAKLSHDYSTSCNISSSTRKSLLSGHTFCCIEFFNFDKIILNMSQNSFITERQMAVTLSLNTAL